MMIWSIGGLLAIICLILSFFFKTRIWDGLIAGAVIATVVGIIMKHDIINSSTSKKIIVVCVLLAAGFELTRRLSIWNSVEKQEKKDL